MKIVCISDTHNQMSRIVIPEGDILIHAGDATGRGTLQEFTRFAAEMRELTKRFLYVIYVPGNHDFFCESNPDIAKNMLAPAVFLLDDITFVEKKTPTALGTIHLERLLVYGSPWQPRFMDWAFNVDRNSEELARIWDKIPEQVDILITHSPPWGILDTVKGVNTMTGGRLEEEHLGCERLRDRLAAMEHKPKLHIFGHIHDSYGMNIHGSPTETIYVNAAICDEGYNAVNKPIVVEL
jgi:Icc-related predicted phosphoesterase